MKLLSKSVIIGADHAAFELKAKMIDFVKSTFPNLKIHDNGCFDTKGVDYPDIAASTCKKIHDGEFDHGILLCGSGIGISIAANKCKGIRAALCHDQYSAMMSRRHNDANVLSFGSRNTGEDVAKQMIETFLTTEWEGLANERHKKRVEKISKLEE